VSPAPAVISGLDRRPPASGHSPPASAAKDAATSSWGRREPTPIARRVGFALFLVSLGFGIGRLTAPRPTAFQALAPRATPSVEPTSVANAVMVPPVSPALAAAPPVATTVLAEMPTGPHDPEPAEKALAAAALPAVPPATSAPTLEPDSPPPRRMGPAVTRSPAAVHSAESASKTAVIPSAPRQVNSFVQAVHDDIAEDEASHKKP